MGENRSTDKKLLLSRRYLRALTASELQLAHGGTFAASYGSGHGGGGDSYTHGRAKGHYK